MRIGVSKCLTLVAIAAVAVFTTAVAGPGSAPLPLPATVDHICDVQVTGPSEVEWNTGGAFDAWAKWCNADHTTVSGWISLEAEWGSTCGVCGTLQDNGTWATWWGDPEWWETEAPSGGQVVVGAGIGACETDQNDNCTGNITFSVVPPELHAGISGPTMVPWGTSQTWYAIPENGVAPFTYSWSGLLSGSAQSASGSLTESGYVYLDIWDNNGQHASTQVFVTVCPYPEISC